MLEKLFLSKTRYKILNYLFTEKADGLTPGQLSQELGEDPGNVSRELQRLNQWGLLSVVKKQGKKVYSLNKQNSYVRHFINLFKIETKEKREDWFVMEDAPNANPTLTISYTNSAYVEKLFADIKIKETPKKYLIIFSRDRYQLCFPVKNYNSCSRAVMQVLLDNPERGIKLNKELLRRSDEFLIFTEKTRKTNLSKLSDKELNKLLEDFFHKQTLMHTLGWIGNVVDFVDNAFSNYLLKYLEKQIKLAGSKIKKGDAFSVLTTPLEQSFAQQEYLNYLKILGAIQKNQKLRKIFKEWDSRFILENLSVKLKELIRQHTEQFGWLGYGVNGPSWDEKYYVDILASLIRQKAKPVQLTNKVRAEQKQVAKKQKEIIKILKIDQKHQKLFRVAQGFVFTKGYRKDAIFHGFWCLEPIHRELARRTNLALKQIRRVYPSEYKKVLQEKEKWSAELNRRWEYHLFYSEKGQHKIVSGQAARRFFKNFYFEPEKIRQVKKLEGDCASPGKVRGVVTIINLPSENQKIKKADILVSASTNPDLMPAIRQAKAIITDIGGLTCHAAIVSRELGIPCVIGTKIATKVLKDGSVVEVDATHGIVNILKK